MSPPTETMLRQALEHLADTSDMQESYLRDPGTWPSLDELALDLDAVAASSEAWTPPVVRERVRLLSQKLDVMSGGENARLWEPEALHGPEWAEVRRLAADALATFG